MLMWLRTGQIPLGASQKGIEGGEVCMYVCMILPTNLAQSITQPADVAQLKRDPSTNPITDAPDAKRMKRDDE